VPYTKGASSPLKIIIIGVFIEAKFYHFFTMSKELGWGCSGNSSRQTPNIKQIYRHMFGSKFPLLNYAGLLYCFL
jgi:hypothetical protein